MTTAKGDRLKPYDDLAEVTTLLQALECGSNLLDRKVAGNRRSDGVKLHRPHHGLERGAAAGRRDMHGGGAADRFEDIETRRRVDGVADQMNLAARPCRGDRAGQEFGGDFSRASKSA